MTATDDRRTHYGATFAVLALAGIAFSLLQSLVAPALPAIQASLHTTPTGAGWILTAYLLTASISTPVLGRLGDMFGKERLLIVVLGALAGGTVVSALATSIGPMLAGRAIQGIGGAIFPLAFGIIRDEFPPARVAQGIALVSALLGIGGGLGIIFAGPIVSHLSYHWLFWIPLVPVLGCLVAARLVIPPSPVRSPGRVGWLGAFLLAGWLTTLLLAVTEGPRWGFHSPRVLALAAAAVLLAVAWVVAEQRSSQPLVDMRMMRRRSVWTVNLTAVLIGAGMYNSFILIPEFVEEPRSTGFGFGASVTGAGLFLLPSTIALLVVSPLAGRIAARRGARSPLIAGAIATMASFLLLRFAHSHPFEIYLASAILGVGLGLAFSSMANLIVAAVPAEQTGVATGMNTIMRTIGGAVGTTIGATVITARLSDGLPVEAGFERAFLLAALAVGIAVLVAVAVPVRGSLSSPLP